MEMSNHIPGRENLCDQKEKSLEEVINHWTLADLITTSKQCQNIPRSPGTLNKLLESIVAQIESPHETTPCSSTTSPNSSSCDSESPKHMSNGAFKSMWWFEDLTGLNLLMIEKLVRIMVSRKLISGRVISKFLLYYRKTRFELTSFRDERVDILRSVVTMLCSLHVRCISQKGLFRLLQVALSLKAEEVCKERLTSMISLGLDRASLDDLLVPCRVRNKNRAYDVELVLRLVRSFLGDQGVCEVSLSRIKKVGCLIDKYVGEIAPDRYLKPSKFLAILRALPDFARDSYDGVYRAVALYFEVHKGMTEEQKMKVCSTLNHEKLSSEVIFDLTQNPNFPQKFAAEALSSQKCRLKSLLHDTLAHPRSLSESLRKGTRTGVVMLYAKKFYHSNESDELMGHLQGMQWRAIELENVCYGMQVQMVKMMNSRVLSHGDAKFVH